MNPEHNILLYKSHGIDSTHFPTFADVTGSEEIKAVQPHHTVFHAILRLLPWEEFNRAIKRHDATDRARGFSHKSHLIAMLYGQLAGAASLRDIEAGLSSHANRLHQMDATPARRASLAEANCYRPAAVFADLLGVMIQRAQRGLRRKMDGATFLIDSTGLVLNGLSGNWARFSAKVCGAKLHIIYDPDADCPIYAAVSTAHRVKPGGRQCQRHHRRQDDADRAQGHLCV